MQAEKREVLGKKYNRDLKRLDFKRYIRKTCHNKWKILVKKRKKIYKLYVATVVEDLKC